MILLTLSRLTSRHTHQRGPEIEIRPTSASLAFLYQSQWIWMDQVGPLLNERDIREGAIVLEIVACYGIIW